MDDNATMQVVDPKIQRDRDLEERNVEELKVYFRLRKPGYEVTVRPWTVNSDCRRFYFGKNEHIFDVRRDVLQDLTCDEIINRLEAARWEQVLKSHPQQVVCFTGHDFKFDKWPH
jgi:hypothetical protein